MAQQDKTTLQTNINTDLADNTTGDIGAGDVRNNLIDITDSLLFNSGSQSFTGELFISATSGTAFKIKAGNPDKEWYVDTTNPDHLKKEGNMILSADPDDSHDNSKISFNIDGNNKASITENSVNIDTGLTVTSGSRGIFKNLNDAIYLGTFNDATNGQSPGFVIKSDISALGSQIVGYKFGEYQPLYLNTDGSSRAKTFIGYSSTQTNDNINAQLNLKNANASYALDVVDGASFRNATTRFENSNLSLIQSYITLDSSSAYPFRPANDNAGEGLAVGRYGDGSNPTNQQIIISYQGGAGRVIAKELNIDAPQLRLELQDNNTTTDALKFTKTSVIINTSSLPTTEPSISGQLWLSGSAGSNSKVLCVRD